MPTQLRGADVVVVGLGAAGGVAVQPLAEAGLDVVGLEAGTWYQAELNLPGQAATRGVAFQTWSNAKPVARTIAHIFSGCSLPTPALMLLPSDSSPMQKTSAP